MKATVEITDDFVRIYEGKKEIVGWVSDEWIEDPTILPSITNAINIANQDNGVRELKRILGKLTANDYVEEVNNIHIFNVRFEDRLYEVQWSDRDGCEAVFPEYGKVEDMSQEDYDNLLDFVRKNLE